jgi:kanamycin kinase
MVKLDYRYSLYKENKSMFPKCINELIKDMPIEEITDFHRSGDLVYSFSKKYILKVSDDVLRLEKEFNKDKWIHKYIPSAKPVLFIIENDKAYYLREYIHGENLCIDKYINNPLLLIELLVEAMSILHKTIVSDKSYIIDSQYDTLIHGDFCLPNILVKDNKVSGFIDLSDSGIGDPWCDYAWCIWSLEYNLKTKDYTPILLEKLGIEFDKEKFERYTKD